MKTKNLFLAISVSAILFACVGCGKKIDVEISPEEGGIVSTTPVKRNYSKGTEVTLTATPNDGYVFVEWTTEDESLPVGINRINRINRFKVENSMKIKANFKIPTLSVSRELTEGGYVTLIIDDNEPQENPIGNQNVAAGTTVTLTATPNEGYVFVEWTAETGTLPSDINRKNPTNRFRINNDVKIRANFQMPTLQVRPNQAGVGNVTVTIGDGMPQENPTTIQSITTGTTVTLTATPNTNDIYVFTNWTAVTGSLPSDIVPTSPTITFDINQNVDIRANFLIPTLQVNTYPIIGGNVRVKIGSDESQNDLTNPQNVAAGTTISLTAIPNDGYRFVNWISTNESVSLANANNATTIFNMPKNAVRISATFEIPPSLPPHLNSNIRYGTFTDTRNGQRYRTVEMPDGKVWMAENLNFATSSGSWCYDNNAANCNIYGRLYDWKTATSVCPAGWYLPSNAEWRALISAVGSNAATRLKSNTVWQSNSRTPMGTNNYGFSALPGGTNYPTRIIIGGDRGPNVSHEFRGVGRSGYWWTSSGSHSDFWSNAQYISMSHNNTSVLTRTTRDIAVDGFSVRCVRQN